MLTNFLKRKQRRTGTCSCSHDQTVHEHYRRGSDCGFAACACVAYRADTAPAGLNRDLHAA